MKRIIAFGLLKIAELLGAWLSLVQVPYCVGCVVEPFMGRPFPDSLEVSRYFGGFIMTIVGVLVLLILYSFFDWLFIDDNSDYYEKRGAAVRWVLKNWELAGRIK